MPLINTVSHKTNSNPAPVVASAPLAGKTVLLVEDETFIADLLVKIIKDQVESKKKWSMANLSSLVRLHLSTYIDLFEFLGNPEKSLLNYKHPNQSQMSMFPNQTRGA